MKAEQLLARVREKCLSLPYTNERASHGAPTFFINGKLSFVTYHNNHHGDGKIAIWCAAPAGLQSILVESNPDIYFVPPYVGHRGWVGLRLDCGAALDDIDGAISEAYLARAPKKYIAELKNNNQIQG